jgi:ferredoxin-thioredoxin reductase catalytic subunit
MEEYIPLEERDPTKPAGFEKTKMLEGSAHSFDYGTVFWGEHMSFAFVKNKGKDGETAIEEPTELLIGGNKKVDPKTIASLLPKGWEKGMRSSEEKEELSKLAEKLHRFKIALEAMKKAEGSKYYGNGKIYSDFLRNKIASLEIGISERAKKDETKELVVSANKKPEGFEQTGTLETSKGRILDLSTQFKVGGKNGFVAAFAMEKMVFGKAPNGLGAEKEVKIAYDIVDPQELGNLDERERQEAMKHAYYLNINRETRKALETMINTMRERKPHGFNQDYKYDEYLEFLEADIARRESQLKRLGVPAKERPATLPKEAPKSVAEILTKKKDENVIKVQERENPKAKGENADIGKWIGKELPCYLLNGKTPLESAKVFLAKRAGLTVQELEKGYIVELVTPPKEGAREMVAKMVKRDETLGGQGVPCYLLNGKTPLESAKVFLAKRAGLTVQELEKGYIVEVVTPPAKGSREMVARIIRK